MPHERRPAGRLARLITSSRDLDLFVLAGGALVLTVLGSAGLANVTVLLSAILGMLAFLAVAQIRSRRQIAQIADASRVSRTDLLQTDFPSELMARRRNARAVLLIGVSHNRTIPASFTGIKDALAAGSSIRVLLVDPDDEHALQVAARMSSDFSDTEAARRNIMNSLQLLEPLRRTYGERLEVRVTGTIPHMGVNAIDIEGDRGMIVLQHYEYRAQSEAGPILRLDVRDGYWYHRLAAEAQRMWEDGQPWSAATVRPIKRSSRPLFVRSFGSEVFDLMPQAEHLFITGVTRNTLLTANYNLFERLLVDGRKLRILLVDPASPAIAVAAERYYAGRSADRARERVNHTIGMLADLQRATGGDITVRLTKHPLAMGIIAIDPIEETPNSVAFIEYYTYQAPGEPKFMADPADGWWFRHFLEEAELLWKQASPLSLEQGSQADPV